MSFICITINLEAILALIPVAISIYAKRIGSGGFKLALCSSLFAILFIGCFYVYFKGANELFFNASLSELELSDELIVWNYWHWARIGLELISLFFLIASLIKIQEKELN